MWYWKKLSSESKSSNGNDFIVLFKVDLLHFININLLESVAKMLKSIAECFTFLRRFPVRLEIPMRSLALVQKWQKTFHNNPANIRLDEDVFKTSWSRQIYSPYSYVFRRRLQEKMCDIVFEKAKGRVRKVNRASVYTEAAVRRVL